MIQKYKKLHWTDHSKAKMRQYSLSKSKLIELLYKPERKEKGIVFGTIALMQTNKSYPKTKKSSSRTSFIRYKAGKKAPGEIWLMYKDVKGLRKIISVWRYPGISKSGGSIPIPEDICQELLSNNEFE